LRQWLGMTKLFCILLIMVAGIYPLLLTGFSKLIFPKQSNGSLIYVKGHVVGSHLIGQSFVQDKYFQGRPSLNQYQFDELRASQILIPGSAALMSFEKVQVSSWPSFLGAMPNDLLLPSASMLDPHLTKSSILKQVPRVANARKINPLWLSRFIELYQQSHWLTGDLVNVLDLNIALDQDIPKS
jgi:K+-transporting ATPase ATPase C chain